MDGMFYQRENPPFVDDPAPAPRTAPLLIATLLAVAVVVGAMLALNWFGLCLTAPDEIPTLSTGTMPRPGPA